MNTYHQQSLFVDEISLPAKIGTALVAGSVIRTLLTPGRGSTGAYDFTLNAYRGCTFGCSYCYAPSFESREHLAERWGTWVEVKKSAMEVLTGVDLRGKSIFMSSVTDPYQPIEAKIGLTRKIVQSLAEKGAHLVVQTRSPLVVRDIDLLKEFEAVRVNISIPTESDELRRVYEPGAPSIEARLRTVRRLKDAGLRASICISPMIPVLDPADFASRINESGADMVTASWFHQSAKPFTANTRAVAVHLNRVKDWNFDQFRAACEILKSRCPAYTSSSKAFGPASIAA